MKPHEISSQYPAFETQQTQEAHLSESLAKPVPLENTEIPASTWLVSGTVGIIVVTTIIFSFKRLFAWREKYDPTSDWNCHQHIPCYNCRFSNRNSYLKCAVHPTKAMKKAAIGCSDYWAKDSDQFCQ